MNKSLALLLYLFLCPVVTTMADQKYYDQQEEIRRAADLLVRHDQYQRDEAKRRADAKERGYSYSRQEPDGWFMKTVKTIFAAILITAFVIFCAVVALNA